MAQQNLHEQLQQASKQIHDAQESARMGQGSDPQLIEQAEQQLQQAEKQLQQAQNQAGREATENPQFQQAYEQLHDTRQQVQEAQQNNNDIL
ncbi:hypothetical protein FH966_11000 [Lentibacillus cibarius]|uniref:DUF2564 family protein n=1 Tax=Lentibacillus cibarius TaxID=2583219 RepID=A0A549YJW0_9BACI|nr:hypothetical protein [Lentibacillus cibarius]TMN23370.1 hypothetical protein FFL34_15650 [Lentibacillus cibarius]TRM12169.1 hypothetical protein FH966_11000 [Lentibacillus cibarius]